MSDVEIANALYTPRLTLTRFNWSTDADTELVIACFNDPAAIAAHGDLGLRTPEDLRNWDKRTYLSVRTIEKAYKKQNRRIPAQGLIPPPLPWYIVHLGRGDLSGECIGIVTIMESTPPVPHIGWGFLHQHAGKGYATEAAKEVLRYWQTDFGIDIMMAVMDVDNLRSSKVAQKIGLADMGFLKIKAGDRVTGEDIEAGGMARIYLTPGAPPFPEDARFELFK